MSYEEDNSETAEGEDSLLKEKQESLVDRKTNNKSFKEDKEGLTIKCW